MEFYCEKAFWKVIPSIRRMLCKSLIKKGANRKEIARILGVSEAAVSQYLKSKRGARIRVSENAKMEIDRIAERILKYYRENKAINKKTVAKDICSICKLMKE